MTTVIERSRKWGEERNRRCLEKGVEQGRREGFEKGRREGVELGIPHGVERGRREGEREFVSRLVARRIGAAAAVHFIPVLDRLAERERVAAIAQLPPRNRFSDIEELEELRSAEELKDLAESLAAWVERAGVPELLVRYRDWVTMVLAPRVSLTGGTVTPGIADEADTTLTAVIERARKWGDELDRQWFDDGVEKGRREGVETGWLKGIGLGMARGIERGWIEAERKLVERLVTEKFGEVAAEQLVPVLAGLSEPKRFAAIADAVLDCETVEGFMARAVDA